jgi:cysteine-rich repeat protein
MRWRWLTAGGAVWFVVSFGLAGCSDPVVMSGVVPDSGSTAARDGGSPDSGGDGGADVSMADAYRPLDGGGDDDSAVCVECVAVDPCQIIAGCEPACTVTTLHDGSACGAGGVCFSGTCRTSAGICGDGFLSPELGESCDDMNVDPGDACSSTCEPTILQVEYTMGESDTPTAQVPAVAADGAGDLLFVWLAQRPGDFGEDDVSIFGRRYTAAGVAIDVDPFVFDGGFGVGSPVVPAVAGLASGWVVTWQSSSIDSSSDPGIAYRILTHDGTLRSRRHANTVELFDQTDPSVVAIASGFVIVWSDTSAELPRHNVRMRAFDGTGSPTSMELPATTTTAMDQVNAFAAARYLDGALTDTWGLVFTDSSGPEVRVRMRRYDGVTPLDATDFDVAAERGSTATLAFGDDEAYVAWEHIYDVHARRIADGTTPTDDTDVDVYDTPLAAGMRFTTDEEPSIAGFPFGGSDGYVVVWHTDSRVDSAPGGRMAASAGVVLPASAADIALVLRGRAREMSLSPTPRGLWFTWADAMVATPATVAAYLLPWE